jgi:hypothetical protein
MATAERYPYRQNASDAEAFVPSELTVANRPYELARTGPMIKRKTSLTQPLEPKAH